MKPMLKFYMENIHTASNTFAWMCIIVARILDARTVNTHRNNQRYCNNYSFIIVEKWNKRKERQQQPATTSQVEKNKNEIIMLRLYRGVRLLAEYQWCLKRKLRQGERQKRWNKLRWEPMKGKCETRAVYTGELVSWWTGERNEHVCAHRFHLRECLCSCITYSLRSSMRLYFSWNIFVARQLVRLVDAAAPVFAPSPPPLAATWSEITHTLFSSAIKLFTFPFSRTFIWLLNARTNSTGSTQTGWFKSVRVFAVIPNV